MQSEPSRKMFSFDSLWHVSEHCEILWNFQIMLYKHMSSATPKIYQNTCSKLTLILFSVMNGFLYVLMFLILPSDMGVSTECFF